MQQNFAENYSKDPNQAAVLLDSLTHRNISDFRYALEVMKCDPNLLDASSGLSVFQSVLQTPKSAEYIKLCINSGANFYKVRRILFFRTRKYLFFPSTEELQQPLPHPLCHQIFMPGESRGLPQELRSVESEPEVQRTKLLASSHRRDHNRKLQ